ncbi:MAG: glycosyltransferase [Pyrinomonadaceae bacterium]|nr:glycosyltransferase [Sphingobacteriaceae bacterium]
MKSKRVLMILPNDTLGGAEQVLLQICKFYSKNQYVIDVFFLKKRRDNNWENIANNVNLYYTSASREKYGLPLLVLNLKKHASKNFYDLAYTSHTHTTGLVGFFIKIKFLHIGKFIARESTTIFDRFTGFRLERFKLMYRIGYFSTDLLICQTHYMKRQLFNNMLAFFQKLRKIEVIPNPISYNEIKQVIFSERPHENRYIVSAGRLIPEKGFDILIQSFKELETDHKSLDLIILGEGPMRNELEILIDSLNLKDRVILKGFQKDVYNYFKHAKLCVVSSRIEGFPNVLLQMMSQNNNVVSTLCAGDIDKISGITTCAPNNIAELKQAIDLALNSDSDKNAKLFDEQLQERDIENFINKVHSYTALGPISAFSPTPVF